MSLINIEYGSIASSDVMNQNFSFLEEKINNNSESVNESVVSILANIATLNLKMNDLTSEVSNYIKEISESIDNLKSDVGINLNKVSMVPNWNAKFTISDMSYYKSIQNGYLLLIPKVGAEGDLTINERKVDINFATGSLVVLPIMSGDIISSNIEFTSSYFLPVLVVTLD